MVVSLHKNLVIKDTEDLTIRQLNSNFGSLYTYVFSKRGSSENAISLNDVLMSLKDQVSITYKNIPYGAIFTWFYGGKQKTDKNIIVSKDSEVMFKIVYSDNTVYLGSIIVNKTMDLECSSFTPNTFLYTINPTPSDATVTLSINGYNPYNLQQLGNTISVTNGMTVNWSVSKTGYIGQSGSEVVTESVTRNITLQEVLYTYTINPTPSTATVTLSASGFVQSGNSISVRKNTVVTWSVSNTGYVTQNGTTTITDNLTESKTLVKLCTLTINPTPSDATVVLTASGYTQSGNSITVPSGTSVTWTVSKTDYATKTGSQTVINDNSLSITLKQIGEVTVDDYEYTFTTGDLVLTKYIGTNVDVIMPNREE